MSGIGRGMADAASHPPAIKDGNAAHPIAGAWRGMLREVVSRFVRGDYALQATVIGVEPVSEATADHIRAAIANYGATLVDLPEEVWETSVAQWYGPHWDIILDLWTAEEGRGDLVLSGRIVESESGTRFSIGMVYVP